MQIIFLPAIYVGLSFALYTFIYNYTILTLCNFYGIGIKSGSFFWGKTLLSYNQTGTEFHLKSIPFGTSVGITGMPDAAREVDEDAFFPEEIKLSSHPPFKRFMITYGFNFLIYLILTILFFSLAFNNSLSENLGLLKFSLVNVFNFGIGVNSKELFTENWLFISSQSNMMFFSFLFCMLYLLIVNLIMMSEYLIKNLTPYLLISMALVVFFLIILFRYNSILDVLLICLNFLVTVFISGVIEFFIIKIIFTPKIKMEKYKA
jgi:hypothetical protein